MRLGLRVRRGLRDWRSAVPLADIVSNYQRSDFSHDAMAGLIVGMVTIPQAVAYALLAGVPPQSGHMPAYCLWSSMQYSAAPNNW